MRILYVVFVLCVAALLFTALAAARHIRRHEETRKSSSKEELAATGELSANPEVEVLIPAGKAGGD
jgi:hypothetical protein